MITPDSSVVIAAFSPWHRAHGIARAKLHEANPRLVAHVAMETVSVLSRMPEGRRIPAPLALAGLTQSFRGRWLSLDGNHLRAALERAVMAGLRGGALYDALIAATAQRYDLRLLSADRRARKTYEAMGVEVVYVAA